MPISYAGHPLLLPDRAGELCQFVDRYLDKTVRGRLRSPALDQVAPDVSPQLPTILYPDEPTPELNRLWWPTGASRWGTFYGLADFATKNAIVSVCYAGGQATLEPLVLEIEDDGSAQWDLLQAQGRTRAAVNMLLLPPEPLAFALPMVPVEELPEDPALCHSLWLLRLVDERYLFQHRTTGNLESSATESWANLFAALGNSLGVSGPLQPATIVNDWQYPSPLLAGDFRNAAVLMDCAAESIGRRFWTNGTGYGITNVYPFVPGENDLPDALTYTAGLKWPIAGGRADVGNSSLPATLRVAFPWRDKGGSGGWYTYGVGIDEALPGFSGVAGDTMTIRSTMEATGTSTTPDNESTRETLASEIAEAFYRSAAFRYDVTVVGLGTDLIHPTNDGVIMRFGTPVAGGWAAESRAWSLPLNFWNQPVQYSAAEGACQANTLGGIPIPDIEGRVQGTWQQVWVNPDGCLVLITPSECSPSSLGG